MALNWKLPHVFYGWWIIGACFIISVYSGGVVIYGFTAFFDPIIKEFGWSYAQVSLAASLRGVETGILNPALGFLVDRWGSKWLILAGSVLTGIGLILLSRVSSLGAFYGIFLIVAVSMSCCGVSVVTPVANHWFRRNLGKAMAIISSGFALGGLLVPVIMGLIDFFNWRTTLVILGAGCLVICVPLSLLVKHKPEKIDYVPGGELDSPDAVAEKHNSKSNNHQIVEVNIGVSQALKSRTFWHLTLAFTLQYIVVGAVITHIMPYLNTVNIARSQASFFAGAIPVISIGGRLVAGWLSDKVNRKQVAVWSFGMVCVGTGLFDLVNNMTTWLLVLAIIIFSLSYGSANTLRSVLTREYFGKSRFGTIFGFLMGILALGAIVGPYLAGWTFDVFQSYHYAWIIFTVINVAALVLLATTPKVYAFKAMEAKA